MTYVQTIIKYEQSSEEDWLKPIHEKADQELIAALAQPYAESEMEFFTVKRLTSKEAVGNIPGAVHPFRYPELELEQTSLF